MLEFLCILLGITCTIPDLPPNHYPPKMAVLKMATSWAVKPPKMAAPKLTIPHTFDPHCPIQPPDDIKKHIVGAARRYPHGATECQLAMQLHTECQTFDPKCYNPRTETIGVAQFKRTTADDLGIDPWDVRDSIYGMAKYVVWCRDRFTPGLAGRTKRDVDALGYVCYNWGLGNVRGSQRHFGWVLYYGPNGAIDHVPGESRNYVTVVMRDE